MLITKRSYTKKTLWRCWYTKRSYKKKNVIGGAGIFGSIANFFARMFSSNAAKQLTSTALQAGKLLHKISEGKLLMWV